MVVLPTKRGTIIYLNCEVVRPLMVDWATSREYTLNAGKLGSCGMTIFPFAPETCTVRVSSSSKAKSVLSVVAESLICAQDGKLSIKQINKSVSFLITNLSPR